MHSISIQRGELGELGPVVLDPASVDFPLPYQHQSEAKPWYHVEQRKLVLVGHDLLFSSTSYNKKSSRGLLASKQEGWFQIAECLNSGRALVYMYYSADVKENTPACSSEFSWRTAKMADLCI